MDPRFKRVVEIFSDLRSLCSNEDAFHYMRRLENGSFEPYAKSITTLCQDLPPAETITYEWVIANADRMGNLIEACVEL